MRDSKIGELVAEDFRKAEIFKQFGLDFCCGGGVSIKEACKKNDVDESVLIDTLMALDEKISTPEDDHINWSADVLVEHIIQKHHTYVERNIPLIREFAHKVARVHGGANPEVVTITSKFDELSEELLLHMKKEEMILFPYIKLMTEENELHRQPPFGTVANPIRMMQHEHDDAGDTMREIRALSSDFTPPGHACNTYKVLYAKLEEFETDLHQHIHLENNILFPKAIKLEAEQQ